MELKLDGTDKIKTPLSFDPHGDRVRGEYVPTTVDSPDPDPATLQQYPKHVTVGEGDDKKVVVAKSKEHEDQILGKSALAEKE